MAFTKITNVDTANKGVVGLPDTPGLSTHDMQAKFDELATDVIIPKHNSLIDELEATTAAASLGAVNTTHTNGANVQTILNELDTNIYTYVDGKDTAMKSYVDGKDASMKSYVDGKDSTMKSYVDNNVATLNSRMDGQDVDIANALRISNIALYNSQVADSKADNAVNTANTANGTAQQAEHDALTALQGLQTIMELISKLLGDIFLNTESEDRLCCENGDRLIMDY